MHISVRRAAVPLLVMGSVVVGFSLVGCDEPQTRRPRRSPPASSAQAEGASPQPSGNKQSSAGALSVNQPANETQTVELAIPEGDADAILAFARRLDAIRPEDSTREAQDRFIRVQKAIVEAADRLMAKEELEEDVRIEAVVLKWNAAILLVNLGDEGAEERFLAFANELAKDENPAIAKTARVQVRQLEIMHQVRDLTLGKAKNPDKLLADLNVILSEEGLRDAQFDLVRQAARILEALGHYPQAAQVYSAMGKAFQESDEPDLAEVALLTAHRGATRLGWIGREPEIEATQLDGETFDLAEHKGKVILVDFWATWCPPCIAEIPNMRSNYDKYRDRGFEIVGISMDHEQAALTRFVAGENSTQEPLPWVTLWTKPVEDADESGFDQHPLAKQFGVDGLPETLLIDQAGKVVAIGVRGERLGDKLEELLGAPDEVADEGAQGGGQ